MATLNDGGPAFPKPLDPYPNAQGMESGTHGMSLRDWFAGQALAGMLADQTFDAPAEMMAESSYRIADAMIRARALPTDGGDQ